MAMEGRALEDGDSGDRLMARIKGYSRLGMAELRKAADAHEVAKKRHASSEARKAIQHYRSALVALQEGLAVAATPAPSSARYAAEIAKCRQRMTKWSSSCKEMLSSLERQFPEAFSAPSSSVQHRSSAPSMRYSSSQEAAGTQAEALSKLDPQLVKMIEAQIIDRGAVKVKWDDIAGLASVKTTLREMVILPMKRKDLFTGLRRPARGLLLFGPPGNGKTMLAKALVAEAGATFFGISAASLTSKWFGEGEKLVRALFAVAAAKQPSVIFIDEIDAIMSTRSTSEHEASRRFKSEFLVQFDGVASNKDDQIVVIGATNRPEDLDDAVRRRLVKRIYVPLPDAEARRALLQKVLHDGRWRLPNSDIEQLVLDTDGYSSSDLRSLCEEAAMAPLRELGPRAETIHPEQVRGLKYADFKAALQVIRPSVSKSQLRRFEHWNEEFGSHLSTASSEAAAAAPEDGSPQRWPGFGWW